MRIDLRENITTKLVGLLVIAVNVVLIWRNTVLLYQYNYTDILFGYMVSEFVLISQIGLGLIGFVVGCLLTLERTTLKTGLIYSGLQLAAVLIIELL